MFQIKIIRSNIFVIIFSCLLLFAGSQLASAQDATPTPASENPQLKKLKEQNEIIAEQQKFAEAQKAIAEAQKAIAEAEKAKFNAEFPKPSSTPLEGKTELEGVKIESEMMAYRALKSAANKIAWEINRNPISKPDNRVAILNDQWLLGLRDYWGTKNKLKLMNADFLKVFAQPPPVVIKVPATPKAGVIGSMYIKPSQRPDPQSDTFALGIKKKSFKTLSKPSFALGSILGVMPSSGSTVLMVDSDDTATNDGGKNNFASAVGAVSGAFGMVGSLVGATVDLLALARTDTKITGFTFTAQESALVSEVYKNLNSSFRYYPAEFSPNLNLQNPSVILGDIKTVGDLKDISENLLVSIEETEKIYQQMIAEKETLEARQKQIPLDIKATEEKIKEINKIPNKQDELNGKLVELIEKLASLNEEKLIGLPKKIKKNAASIANLELKLSQLYSEIERSLASGAVVNKFIEIAKKLDDTSRPLLGATDNYTLEDLEGITTDDKDAKKRLIAAAEKNLGRKLTMDEKVTLLEPYDMDRLKVFVKVGKYIRSNPSLSLPQIEPAKFLSDVEQLMLFYDLDERFLMEKNNLAKIRGIKLIKLKSLNKQFDKFYEEIIKTDALGINPITKHLQTENMLDAFGCSKTAGTCPDAYALVLKVIDVGGNNKVKKNLLTMVATGDNITHSGGAIVEYKFYDMNGKILTSSVCTAYEPYIKAKNINAENNINALGQNSQRNVGCQMNQTYNPVTAQMTNGDNETDANAGSEISAGKLRTTPVIKRKQ